MKKQLVYLLMMAGLWMNSVAVAHALTDEPDMLDYTNYPIFQTNAVTPNIHIVLDNSGSMNFNAYGTWPGDNDEVTEPYACAQASSVMNIAVSGDSNDAEQRTVEQNTWTSSTDLDFGGYYSGATYYQTLVGIRFQNIPVPPGETIKRAYIQLTGSRGGDHTGEATSLLIYGQDTGSPGQFSSNNNDISTRPMTVAPHVVAWNNLPDWGHQQSDNDTRTPDLTTIVQHLVDRGDWASGNSMAFIFARSGATGKRDVYAGDTGTAAYRPVLHIELDVPDEGEECTTVYYGYFDPTTRYSYNASGQYFVRDSGGDWDGNWLNWCVMRRIDVLRKVLVGGRAETRDSSGTTILRCEIPAQTSRGFYRILDGTEFTPHDGIFYFGVRYGYLYVDDDTSPWTSPLASYNLRVRKTAADEPQDFLEGNVVGVLQRIGDRARWGNQWFYSSSAGGVANPIGTDLATLIANIETKGGDTSTPLSENYYVATQYFSQKHGSYYTSNNWYPSGNFVASPGSASDPYYIDGEPIRCAKSFCLFLTDGAPTNDRDIPSSLKNYDGDTHEDDRTYDGSGSDYLDDIALYARTTDLRKDASNGLDGDQNLILYTVYAFGNEQNARDLLMDAAKNGGFIDKDDDNKPDTIGDPRGGDWSNLGSNAEWDSDGDNVPDNYFEAQDGYQLEQELLAAINDILKRTASGTAVSVLATKGEGEGTLVQAFFKPRVISGVEEVKWIGYLQSLWVDQFGNTREDTNQNQALDIDEDNILQFFLDEASGETKVKLFEVSEDREYPDNATWDADKIISLEDILAIWEGGSALADQDESLRNIYTYKGSTNSAANAADIIAFDGSNSSTIGRFLGVEDNATWNYMGSGFENRVNNLISFVRGVPDDSSQYEGSPTIRPRTMDDGRLWKLGDIIYSTPMSISKPVEHYGLLYDDTTYNDFLTQYRDRETVVYVGANDGMLHAFTSGVYDADNQTFENPYDVPGYFSGIPDEIVGNVPIGSEMWAYIPQNLLPHLKWLPREDYTHVPYVDLKPKVVDAQIYTSPTTANPGGWATVLICGLNMGGKQIQADNGTYNPCFFAFDVTNPRDPKLLWERTYSGLGLTTNMPAVLTVGNSWNGSGWNRGKWYLAISSGPTEYDGSSNQKGRVYIVDLKTGESYHDFETAEGGAYMNTPVALDKSMNYNVDTLYVAANYNNWESRVYKITVPQDGVSEFDPQSTDYDTNPDHWEMAPLFYSPVPITAPVSLSLDRRGNVWMFAGTGRYIEDSDKDNADQNYLFGIKDPFFNASREDDSCYHKYGAVANAACEVNGDKNMAQNLFDAGVFAGKIKVGGDVEGVTGIDNYGELLEAAREDKWDGWFRKLCLGGVDDAGACIGSGSSERVLNKPAVLGGMVLYPTFAPNSEVCGYGGNGRLFAVFYETGTAFRERVMGPENQDTVVDVIGLGEGISSSFGVHVGKQEGGTLYGQMSTGVVTQLSVNPAFAIRGTPIYWSDTPKRKQTDVGSGMY